MCDDRRVHTRLPLACFGTNPHTCDCVFPELGPMELWPIQICRPEPSIRPPHPSHTTFGRLAMASCEVCGNDYDKTFTIEFNGESTFSIVLNVPSTRSHRAAPLPRSNHWPWSRRGRPRFLLRQLRTQSRSSGNRRPGGMSQY